MPGGDFWNKGENSYYTKTMEKRKMFRVKVDVRIIKKVNNFSFKEKIEIGKGFIIGK